MTGKRHSMLLLATGAFLSSTSQVALAAPSEPLVVSQLADPDPTFIPPKPEPRKKGRRAHAATDETSSLDQAMQNLGMVIGQAAEMEGRKAGATAEQIAAGKREIMQRMQERMSSDQPD